MYDTVGNVTLNKFLVHRLLSHRIVHDAYARTPWASHTRVHCTSSLSSTTQSRTHITIPKHYLSYYPHCSLLCKYLLLNALLLVQYVTVSYLSCLSLNL